MKKIIWIAIIVIVLIATVLFLQNSKPSQDAAQQVPEGAPQQAAPIPAEAPTDEQRARSSVTSFGLHLKNVSTTADAAVAADTIKKEYSSFVSPELLKKWMADPSKAPGRPTSSPWPDHIEITGTQALGESYEFNGNIVMMTSTGESGRTGVTIITTKVNGQWRITSYTESKQ